MEHSATYLTLEKMMRKGCLVMAVTELSKSLNFFELQGLITSAEHKALLELAMKVQFGEGRLERSSL